MRDGTAVESIIGIAAVCLAGFAIVLVGLAVVALVEIAVGYAVVCIAAQLGLVAAGLLYESQEFSLGAVHIAALEICICKTIYGFVAVGVAQGYNTLVAFCRGGIVALVVKCLATPVERFAVCTLVVLRQGDGAVEILYGLVHIAVYILLHTQAVENLLFCLINHRRRGGNLLYRLQCHVVVACVHIYLYKVFVHLVGVF